MTTNTRPRNIGDVLNRLSAVKPAGPGKWTASCPCASHDTPAKHLSVQDAGDKALVSCHPGPHTYDDICAALGFDSLSYSNNGHPPVPAPARKPSPTQKPAEATGVIECTYDYLNADSKLLFQVVRYRDPKDFKQRRPDGKGGYIWNLTGVSPVLYHLPDVRTAVADGDLIPLCEGEKDADSALLLGYIATTAPMGAGKWQPEYSETLRGAMVVIIPDLDEAGRQHADTVAWSLWGVAASVRVLTLPEVLNGQPVKDLTDWMAASGDRDAFDELLAECEEYQPPEKAPEGRLTVRRMSDVIEEAVEWLWHPYIPRGKVTLIEGDPGEGKSHAALAIGSGISNGQLYGAGRIEPGNILLASAEDGLADTIKPRLRMLEANTSRIYAVADLLTLDDAGTQSLEKEVLKYLPALLIIDPLQAYLGGELDINRANQTRHVMAQLHQLAERYHMAIIVIRHLTKGQSLKPIYRGLGSIDFTASARSVLLAGQDPETGNHALVHIKCNLSALGPSIGYEIGADGVFRWTGTSDIMF